MPIPAATTSPQPSCEQDACLRLIAIGGPAAPRRRLLQSFANAHAALSAGASAWSDLGLDDAQIGQLEKDTPPPVHWRHWLSEPGHHLVDWTSDDYPALLRDVPGPPLALFVAGNVDLLWHPSIAIVGSRSATPSGLDHAREFSHALGRAGFAITSGMALGVDAAAHRAALDARATTIAVLGCGIDRPYPSRHADLYADIVRTGAVVSEHPPGVGPHRNHFPSRNRIIAGLSLGTLVIEAATRSGALITARQASEAGREVFAIPGSIRNPLTQGCHQLIRDGATLVESPNQVIEPLAVACNRLGQLLRERLNAPTCLEPDVEAPAMVNDSADPDYHTLWAALCHDPSPMDQLVERTGLTSAELSSMLLIMELEGRVVNWHGRYSRKS